MIITKKEYLTIINDPAGDTTLKELEESKHNITQIKDLIKYLTWAITHNYYTGSYWSYLYNFNNELEDIISSFNLEDEYLKYLAHYCDSRGDIFIYSKYAPDNYAPTGSELEDKIRFITEHYDRILTPSEFDNFFIVDKEEYVKEVYQIPAELEYFIDYKKLYSAISWDEGIEELNNDSFIIFELLEEFQ